MTESVQTGVRSLRILGNADNEAAEEVGEQGVLRRNCQPIGLSKDGHDKKIQRAVSAGTFTRSASETPCQTTSQRARRG